jgi:two-component system invasion response regulator UvrY
MSDKVKKILIFEDHEIVAAGVAGIIRNEFHDIEPEIAYTFADGLDLLKALTPVDLIILDVKLPGSEGTNMISRIRHLQQGARILVFSALEDAHSALTFMTAGANGFASKTLNMKELKGAIQTVLGDKKFMSEEVQQKVAESFFQNLSPSALYEDISLSAREREIMNLLMAGKRTKEISSELNIKYTTVSTHKAHIFKKMSVDNIVELINKCKKE